MERFKVFMKQFIEHCHKRYHHNLNEVLQRSSVSLGSGVVKYVETLDNAVLICSLKWSFESNISSWCLWSKIHLTETLFGIKYSRMDQAYPDHIPSNFLKHAFHKLYLVHSWILWPIYDKQKMMSFISFTTKAISLTSFV